jgi:putative transposase
MKKEEKFDFAKFEKEAIKKLRSGKGLIGEQGALRGLIGRILKAAYEEEISEHISNTELEDNRRNGSTQKKIRTGLGDVNVQPPRDRNGSFNPQIIKKWERQIAPELEGQILSLYAIGTSTRDISEHMNKMYGVTYSPSFISGITDRIIDEVEIWKSRPLDDLYAIIYLDAIHFKVRENRKVVTKAVYTVFGVDMDGQRDVLGLYIGQSEGARHWGRILENIRERGVKDVIFFCVDGLAGFSEVIEDVYPRSLVQRCIVHMVRTSVKHVAWQDLRAVCKDLKAMYSKDSSESALEELGRFEIKWGDKYPEIARKWKASWDELSVSFDYPKELRKIIYTTNTVEALHRILRKTTKTKGAFVNDQALEKQLYLTLQHSKKSWQRKTRGWPVIVRVLQREFPERIIEN